MTAEEHDCGKHQLSQPKRRDGRASPAITQTMRDNKVFLDPAESFRQKTCDKTASRCGRRHADRAIDPHGVLDLPPDIVGGRKLTLRGLDRIAQSLFNALGFLPGNSIGDKDGQESHQGQDSSHDPRRQHRVVIPGDESPENGQNHEYDRGQEGCNRPSAGLLRRRPKASELLQTWALPLQRVISAPIRKPTPAAISVAWTGLSRICCSISPILA